VNNLPMEWSGWDSNLRPLGLDALTAMPARHMALAITLPSVRLCVFLSGILEEQYNRILYNPMPVIWIKPTRRTEIDATTRRYQCPMYKTSERRGLLSTTGHSTNYVLTVLLDTNVAAEHWIKRGTALLCQLDD